MDNRPIGIFDSGLGGLNVLKEIRKVLPNESFIYLGDTKRFPYGQKSKDTIIEISKQNVEFLISQDVKCIVIACGTATSQALGELKKIYKIPIYGIIEPTVINLKKRIKKPTTIGIIATKGTIRSREWAKTIENNIPNATVVSHAAPLLATMAEEGWTTNKVAEYTVKEYMSEFKGVDKLILGCTHYPLFKKLMQKELSSDVEIVDTGIEMATFLDKELKSKHLESSTRKGKFKMYLTDIENAFAKSAANILEDDIDVNDIGKFEV